MKCLCIMLLSAVFSLSTDNLRFEIAPDASGAAFVVDGKEDKAQRNSDFWRLFLDDGVRTELPVRSSRQKGTVTKKGGVLTVHYDSVVADDGKTYPVSFTVTASVEDGLLKFSSSVTNNDDEVRVNECFCPLADFTELEGAKKEDALYFPAGLGQRFQDPWKMMTHRAQTGGTSSGRDNEEVWMHTPYPRASMAWYGVQSADKFLYLARYDKDMRFCFLSVRQKIEYDESNLMFGTCHIPMARKGETVDMPSTVIGLLDGDWRSGADRYRAWADRNFFKVTAKYDWVKNLPGWQRLSLTGQNGEIRYRFEDLPALYESGKKFGLNTLFLFAWWKEGMDNGYPEYNEPYPGAYKVLEENIRKVQEMGGHVILVCNAHFVDKSTDYYKKYGQEVELLNIEGNSYPKRFAYSGLGEFNSSYRGTDFAICCFGSERWRKQVISQLKMMGDDFGADCVFADCVGGCPMQPCFNPTHEHGYRPDGEWTGHRKFFQEAMDYSYASGKVFGTEVLTDIAASYTQFVHSLVNAEFKIKSNLCPEMFRYTFPEVITSCRHIQNSYGDFAKQFKYALTMGVRIDAALFGCRCAIETDPVYAEQVRFYTSHMDKYGEFYYDGKFTVIDTSPLPYYIKRAEYLSADGKKVLRILYNASDKERTACGVTLAPDELKYEVFRRKDYEGK